MEMQDLLAKLGCNRLGGTVRVRSFRLPKSPPLHHKQRRLVRVWFEALTPFLGYAKV